MTTSQVQTPPPTSTRGPAAGSARVATDGVGRRVDGIAPGSLRAWVLATRPPTLTAALAPVAVGTAVAFAEGGLAPAAALAAAFGALWIQIGTNFANDVFDAEKGADDGERLGPTRAVAAGLLTPAQMRRGMWVAFGLAMVAGLYLARVAGWPVYVLGLASIAAGIAYTGGPFPLAYNGLGDLFVMAFFGFAAVVGTTWVQTGTAPPAAWIAALPMGALATGVLVVNNLRDRFGDARAGKRTLAVRFGRRGAIAEYLTLVALAYAAPAGLVALGLGPWVLLPWLTAPAAIRLVSGVVRREGRALNPLLAGTARLLALYGVLLAAGVVVAGVAG